MPVSVRSMEALRAVSDAGSFAAAAREIGLTPPGITHLIRKIEEDYQVELFMRAGGKLTPTAFCEKLCDATDRVIAEHQRVESMLRRHGKLAQGELAIGLGNAMPGMSVIAAFNKAYPDVRLRVSTGSYEKIIREVIDHTADVGILPEVPRDDRFRREVLLTNRVTAIVSLSHPLARYAKVTCDQLLEHRLIFRSEGSSTQKVVDRYFRRHGAAPKPFLTLDTRDGVYEAVVEGLGVGFAWQTGSGRNEDVEQITLDGGGTESAEVVFAPIDRQMETVEALFGIVNGMRARRTDHP